MSRFGIILCVLFVFSVYSYALDCSTYAQGARPWNEFNFGNGQVTITSGQNVILSHDVTLYGGLKIDHGGFLWFDINSNVRFEAQNIMVNGEFHIGSETCHYNQKAVIVLKDGYNGPTLTDPVTQMPYGKKVFGVGEKGVLELHGGKGLQNSWTKLDQTVERGQNTITLIKSVDWQVGDEIVVASTDFHHMQAEKVKIVSVSNEGRTFEVTPAFTYMHFGKITYGVDERAEVGLLSRSIRLEGTDEGIRGAHLMFQRYFKAVHVEGVEFYNVGQGDEIGRYPVHFHLVVGAPQGTYIKDCSVHKSHFRCYALHGTNNVLLKGNVAYDSVGHCYFVEDGVEYDNVFDGNLGLVTKQKTSGPRLGSDEQAPCTFWLTNPRITVINNVAAGSHHTGFWFLYPDEPNGLSFHHNLYPGLKGMISWKIAPFSGNVAHSCGTAGFMFEPTNYGGDVGTGIDPSWIHPFLIHIPREDDGSVAWIDCVAMTAYKIRQKAFWTRGAKYRIVSSFFADNDAGITLSTAGSHIYVNSMGLTEHTLFVGFTENIGDWNTPLPGDYPHSPERGCSTPRGPGIPRRGYQIYDGPQRVVNSRFLNFNSDSEAHHSAIGYFYYNTWQNAVTNGFYGCKFENSNNYWLTTIDSEPAARLDGDTNTATFDGDGCYTQNIQSTVVNDYEHFKTSNCISKPEWKAAICPLKYANVWFENLNTPGSLKNGLDMTNGNIFGQTFWVKRDQYIGSSPPIQSLYGMASTNQHGERYRYQILAIVGASYTICHPPSPHISLQLNNVDQGDFIRYGVYYPPHTTGFNVVRGLYRTGQPNPIEGQQLHQVDNVNHQDFLSGNAFVWDSAHSLLFVKLVQRYDRTSGEDYCPSEGCEIVWIQASVSGTPNHDFCSPNAYPDYQESSGGIFDVKLSGMNGVPADPYEGLYFPSQVISNPENPILTSDIDDHLNLKIGLGLGACMIILGLVGIVALQKRKQHSEERVSLMSDVS